MAYRLPNGLCEIKRNPTPVARFTGAFWPWLVIIEGKTVYCDSRQSARDCVTEYRRERFDLIKQGETQNAKLSFCED